MLKNVGKLVEQTSQTLMSCYHVVGMCIYVQICQLHSWWVFLKIE